MVRSLGGQFADCTILKTADGLYITVRGEVDGRGTGTRNKRRCVDRGSDKHRGKRFQDSSRERKVRAGRLLGDKPRQEGSEKRGRLKDRVSFVRKNHA